MLYLQRPYSLHCDFVSGLFSVPLELSGRKESGLRYASKTNYRTENYQLARHVLENGLAALQVTLDEIQVELSASQQQHIMQLYCSKHLNNAYRFFWKAMGLAYANPPFSLLAKVLTKIAYEGGRVVMCTPDWGCSGEHAYWRCMLDRMTVGRVQLPDGPIYVPEDSDTAMQAPEWAGFLSIVDGSLNHVPLCDLDQVLLKKVMAENRGLTLCAVRMDECAPGGYPAPTGYERPPSGWTSARPEGAQPLPATNSRRPDGRESAPQRRPAHATPHAQPKAQHTERAHRCTRAKRPRTPYTQHNPLSGRTGAQEPSGPGHRTRNTTHRAGAPVNRSQVAQDTAHAKQHTQRAHR